MDTEPFYIACFVSDINASGIQAADFAGYFPSVSEGVRALVSREITKTIELPARGRVFGWVTVRFVLVEPDTNTFAVVWEARGPDVLELLCKTGVRGALRGGTTTAGERYLAPIDEED